MTDRAWARWLPAVAAPAVVAVGAVALASQAGAAPDLPDLSAEELLTLVSEPTVEAYSGTFEQVSDLGLPDLPAGIPLDGGPTTSGPQDGSSGAGGLDLSVALEMIAASHTGRVYVGGPDTARLQVLDTLAERDVVRNGEEVWVYDSRDNVATHITVPDHPGEPWTEPWTEPGAPTAGHPTPGDVVDRLLTDLDPSTAVTVGRDAVVAGRESYELVLAPRDEETLVESVSIAVDGETGLPLGVTVLGREQSDPAFSLAYTAVNLTAPDPDLFEFTPPPGATVVEAEVPDGLPTERTGKGTETGAGPTVSGEGWGTVVVLPPDAEVVAALDSPPLAELTREVDGGRVLTTSLVTVLVADDGRVLVGSVPAARLQAVAGT